MICIYMLKYYVVFFSFCGGHEGAMLVFLCLRCGPIPFSAADYIMTTASVVGAGGLDWEEHCGRDGVMRYPNGDVPSDHRPIWAEIFL